MEEQFYRQLVQRYVSKKLTDEELEVFIHLMNENKLDKYLLEEMNKDAGIEAISQDEYRKASKTVNLTFRIAFAAAIVLFLSFGLYFYNNPQQATIEHTVAQKVIKIAPGGNKAILTLADGKKIILNNQKTGELTRENTTLITKAKDGLLIYNPRKSDTPTDLNTIAYNTIQTPRGGQYQVVLPDGSKAWLNASSSIRFPIVFADNERKVEITGEVYFEVAHNKEKPFRVASHNQLIEVLGTQFNVNAYADEASTKTTLLEGSVKVYFNRNQNALLKPGQQAIIASNHSSIKVQPTDTEEAIAWKNGYFKFNRVDIQTLMRQISRWYDIDIEYEGKIPDDELVGKINRSEEVTEVLRILKLGKIDFRLEGRKVIIGKI